MRTVTLSIMDTDGMITTLSATTDDPTCTAVTDIVQNALMGMGFHPRSVGEAMVESGGSLLGSIIPEEQLEDE